MAEVKGSELKENRASNLVKVLMPEAKQKRNTFTSICTCFSRLISQTSAHTVQPQLSAWLNREHTS